MVSVRLALVIAAASVLVVPSALAESARGELETGAIHIPQAASLDSLGLHLLSLSSAPPQVQLVLTDVALQRIGQVTTSQAFPDVTLNQREIDERATYSTATVTITQGEGDQLLALRTLGPATATLGPSEIRGVGGAFLAMAASGESDGAGCGAEALYCLDILGAYEFAGDAIAELRGGELTLLLHGPTLRVSAPEGEREFASGRTSAQETGTVSQVEETWVVLRARDATGSISAAGADLYSTAPTVRSTALEFVDADGSMRVGARSYQATSDDIAAAGELVLTPGPIPPASSSGASGQPIYASSFRTRVSGEVESINLNAKPVFLDTPAKQAGFAAFLAVLVGAAVYAWQHVSFAFAALYTRLNKPDILDNDVRNRIYDIIRHNPGISAREVHRRSEQSWGTVVYHLRQLERHHLVVSRALGRTRNYYENHGKYRGMEVQLACLQSERALTLARAIAGQPGITQEQLATASGYPQPTTSYYVRKLKQAGLVEEQREGRYVRYVPHADLPRFISLAESPNVGAPAPSGVQA